MQKKFQNPESVRTSLEMVLKSEKNETPGNPCINIKEVLPLSDEEYSHLNNDLSASDRSDYIYDSDFSLPSKTLRKRMVTRNVSLYQADETSPPNFQTDDTLSNNEKKLEVMSHFLN